MILCHKNANYLSSCRSVIEPVWFYVPDDANRSHYQFDRLWGIFH